MPLCSQAQTAAQTAGPQVPPPATDKSKKPRDAIQTPVRTVPDPGVITTRQIIAPAGVQAIFESRVYGASFGEANDFVYVLATSRDRALVYKLDWRANHAVEVIELPGYPGFQGITFDPVKQVPLVTGTSVVKRKGGKSNDYVRIFSISNGEPTVVADRLGSEATGGVAISEDADGAGRQVGVVPLTFDDAVAIVNLASGSLKWKVRTGVAPFGAAVSAARRRGVRQQLGRAVSNGHGLGGGYGFGRSVGQSGRRYAGNCRERNGESNRFGDGQGHR